MNDFVNNLDEIVDQMMLGIDLEKLLFQIEGFSYLLKKLAPQEMDRLVNILFTGFRAGLLEIVTNKIEDGQKQLEIIKKAVEKELRDASADMGIKDLEKKFNVNDFCSRAYDGLTLQKN